MTLYESMENLGEAVVVKLQSIRISGYVSHRLLAESRIVLNFNLHGDGHFRSEFTLEVSNYFILKLFKVSDEFCRSGIEFFASPKTP